MDAAVKMTRRVTLGNLRAAQILTALIVVLAMIASAGGLFINGLYRDPVDFVPVLQGQDLVTLIAMPVLVVILFSSRGGSARATMVWIGLLGYLLYTYMGAATGYYFNRFFLVYAATFSLSIFALITLAGGIDVAGLQVGFDASAPRKPVAVFLILIALMLAAI